MTEEFDVVMLDAGGTLWDMRPSREERFVEILHRHGREASLKEVRESFRLAEGIFDQAFAKLDGVNEYSFWLEFDQYIIDRLGLKVDVVRLSEDMSREYRALVNRLETWVAFPDAVPLLKALKKRELKVGLVSNATSLARRVLRNLDMDRYFDFVVISAEVGSKKPEPRIFEIALETARAHPSRALYVGDKYAVDIVGANRAGMHAILVDRYNVYPNVKAIKVKSLKQLMRYL